MSVVFRRGVARTEANLTPMIDVTFLLIIFFVLVSQIVEVESVEMHLPEPVDPATDRIADEQRAVINVIPGPDGRALAYRLGSRTIPVGAAGLARLTAGLAERYAANPDLNVNLRADRGTSYEWIAPVIAAVQDAARAVPGAPIDARLNLVVVRED